MSNYLLKPIFKSIFDRDFQSNIFEDRLEMQKIIYLLQSMSICIGNYGFMWYINGLYSQTLQNDILNLHNVDDIDINYSADAKKEIKVLKNVILKKGLKYNECQWVECLGSLHYIKENILSSSADDKTILNMLRIKRPYLNNDKDNKIALQTLKKMII